MVEGSTQTVSFQAAKTNSSPPPLVLPYHIEQGLRGEVGTTRLPAELSSISRFLGWFIALLNFSGLMWILRDTPIIAIILAIIVSCISLSLSGLFFGIPYLKQRRNDWMDANWRVLTASLFIVWASSTAVVYHLVFYAPNISEHVKSALTAAMSIDNSKKITEIKTQIWIATHDCVYRCQEWREELSRKLDRVEKVQADSRRLVPNESGTSDNDTAWNIGVFAVLVAALGVAIRIAAYGGPFSSETGNAIWREPYTGYADNQVRPTPSAPQDQASTFKKRGFDHWLKSNISLSGDTSIAVDAVYGDYRKFLDDPEKHITPPPAYNLSEFKIAFKSATGKEPVDIKGVSSYQGVSFAGTGLI